MADPAADAADPMADRAADPDGPFTIVIPTYRRSALLERLIPSYLDSGPHEVIVVDDASGPGHHDALERVARRPGVRLVRVEAHGGQAVAKNQGASLADTDWVVFGEDDVWFTPEYPRLLIRHVLASGALAGCGSVPLVHPRLLAGPVAELNGSIRASRMDGPRTDRLMGRAWPVRSLPSGDVQTPLLPACAAVHRTVFDRVRFDRRYTGNAFREETDFFLTCAERGIRTVWCPHASCGHVRAHSRANPGGSWTMGRTRYAAQMVRNNWRFLRAHQRTVADALGVRGPAAATRLQARFLVELAGRVRARRA